MRRLLAAVLMVLGWIGSTPAPAWGQSGNPTPYMLNSPSSFARGCFGPCACPVIESKLTGTFDLRSLPPDPLYSYYTVENVKWIANEPGHPLPIIGSGTYRVGGEVALRERMTLDLSVDGGPIQHYDSGDVDGGGDFPRITIPVRLHTTPVCLDTVITIDASPGVVGVDPRQIVLPRMSPNPFASRADLSFELQRESQVRVTILDLAGRRVRRLVRDERLGPGVCSRSWDGATDEGIAAPAGIYRVRIETQSQATELGVVKLR
jgi:hypothetical protein